MPIPMSNTPVTRTYKYYDFIVVAFVCVLLCSNLIGPGKAAQVELPLLGTVVFGAGVLFFPIAYTSAVLSGCGVLAHYFCL